MPAINTHYLFAKRHLEKESPYPDAFILASQGPDPFFFFGQLPWKRKEREHRLDINRFGIGLHHEDITDIYVAMLEYARESEDKGLLLSFMKGIFLHYVLDRNCHPYIFSKTGFSSDPEMARFYSSCHTKSESAIDKILGERDGSWNEDVSYCFGKISEEDLLQISRMFFEANLLTDKYPFLEKDSYLKSVKDYMSVMKFVNKPHYFKRMLTSFFGKESMAYSLNYPRNLKKAYGDIDFLNEKHSSWPDPFSGEERRESFLDLEKNAYEDYLQVLPLLEKEIQGENKKKEIRAWVNSLTHDGGKVGEKMKFMSPFFSKRTFSFNGS
ncbi:MAG TPA: hypothetical protein DDW18_04750 [Firmicutes bacterium]|nr:hypothetical protein [Bacillota bacterium]